MNITKYRLVNRPWESLPYCVECFDTSDGKWHYICGRYDEGAGLVALDQIKTGQCVVTEINARSGN